MHPLTRAVSRICLPHEPSFMTLRISYPGAYFVEHNYGFQKVIGSTSVPPWGGCTLSYRPYWYVPPRFGLKKGIDFAHLGLESGLVFEGTTGVHEYICCFNSK